MKQALAPTPELPYKPFHNSFWTGVNGGPSAAKQAAEKLFAEVSS
jgi:hypothetical protein